MYIFVRNNGADNKIIVSRPGTNFVGKGRFLNEVRQGGNRKIALCAAVAGIDIFQTTKVNEVIESVSCACTDSAISCFVCVIRPR